MATNPKYADEHPKWAQFLREMADNSNRVHNMDMPIPGEVAQNLLSIMSIVKKSIQVLYLKFTKLKQNILLLLKTLFILFRQISLLKESRQVHKL